MAESRVYKGDVGLVIDIDMGENISSATNLKFYVQKPDNSEVTWTPSLQGTDSLRYTTVTGDLSLSGKYCIQPSLTLGGWSGRGTSVAFQVYGEFS